MASDLQPDPEFTIVAASALREQWLAWLTETSSADYSAWPQVKLDLSAVESFDSAAVQLVLSLGHSLHRRGQNLALVSPAPCVRDALGRYGLNGHFAEVERTAKAEAEAEPAAEALLADD